MNSLLSLVVLVSAAGGMQGKLGDVPKLLSATLVVGQTKLEGRLTHLGDGKSNWPEAFETAYGDRLVHYEKDSVVARPQGATGETWRFASPDGRPPRVAASDAGHLYVASARADDSKEPDNQAVWKIGLETGRLADKLVLPAFLKPWVVQSVIAVLPGSKGVAVLTKLRQSLDPYEYKKPERACLFFYSPAGKLLWQRQWAQQYFSESRGALLASSYPNFSDASVVPLSWVGDQVLVCSTPAEPLRLLEAKDGKDVASLEHLWEFRRFFIGPSVWSHRVGLNGYQGFLDRHTDKATKPNRDVGGKILSGPVVVPFHRGGNSEGYLIYVVALRTNAKEPLSEYSGDSFLYEIRPPYSDRMEPTSVTPMPRYTHNGGWVEGDSVTWACQEDSMVRVSPSQTAIQGFGNGPGGPDCVGKVDWYRQYDPVKPKAWLHCGDSPGLAALAQGLSISAVGAAYVMKQGDSTMRLPMAATDLRTGARRHFELEWTLDKPVPKPTENLYEWQGEVSTFGPYHFGIGLMNAAGSRLQIALGREETLYKAEFDLDALVKAVKTLPAE